MVGFPGAEAVNSELLLLHIAKNMGNLEAQGLMGLTNDETETTLIDEYYNNGIIDVN